MARAELLRLCAASDSSGGRKSVATKPIAANKIATAVIVRVGAARRSDAGISGAQPFLQPELRPGRRAVICRGLGPTLFKTGWTTCSNPRRETDRSLARARPNQGSLAANLNVKDKRCSRFARRNLRVTIASTRREGRYALVCLDRGGACCRRAGRRRRRGRRRAEPTSAGPSTGRARTIAVRRCRTGPRRRRLLFDGHGRTCRSSARATRRRSSPRSSCRR